MDDPGARHAVDELVNQINSVAILWRERINTDLRQTQQVETVTLDFEFKTMARGWPASADGPTHPPRLVTKQARSLDPGLRSIPDEVLALSIPRDVLARASLVREVECTG